MTEDQKADHAASEAKLIRLLIRRHNLPRDSADRAALTLELENVEDLVRSCRIVKALGA